MKNVHYVVVSLGSSFATASLDDASITHVLHQEGVDPDITTAVFALDDQSGNRNAFYIS